MGSLRALKASGSPQYPAGAASAGFVSASGGRAPESAKRERKTFKNHSKINEVSCIISTS
jgi:hypothetical protein